MWVERLEIRGYKRLSGEFDFDRRLSIICGVNEAGKSSMHDAVVRALFGFSRSERRRSGGSSELERCAPWNGNPYALHATVSTNGGRLRLEWDLNDHEVTVRNLDSGEDLSARMVGSGGDVKTGDYLLGLELEDFRQACCLDQGAISAVPHSEDLVVAMQRAVEAGTGDSGVEAADELLLGALSDDIGVRRDNLQPKATGRLAGLIDRQQGLETQLELAEGTQREVADLEAQCEKVNAVQTARREELVPAEQGLLREKERELAGRLRRAREHSERADAELPEVAELSNDDQTAIVARLTELDRLEETVVGLRPQAAAAAGSIEKLEGRRHRLQAEFDGLAPYETTDTSGGAEIQGLIARRRDLAKQMAEAPLGQPAPPEPEAARGSRPGLALASILAAASIIAGVLITPAAFAGLLLAGAAAYFVGRKSPTTDAAIEQRLAADRQRKAVQMLSALDEELTSVLDRAGASEGQDVEQRAHVYIAACKNHERWTELRGDLGELRGELAAAGEPILEVDRAERRIEELRVELEELFSAIEILESDLAVARREFKLRVEQDRELSRRHAAAGEAAEGLVTALGEMTMQELTAAQEAAAQRLDQHIGVHGELEPGAGPGQLADLRRQLGDEMRQLDIDHASLQTQIRDREERLPDVPALREESERLGREIAQLRDIARSIDIARGALKEAAHEAHRAFRPRLKQALDRNLARITNGRYSQVEIDDELNLSLIAPETGRMVPADRLSKGTQDQIFFVERLEMIDLLDPTTGEAPLLLDEPFAHFDGHRLTAALQLLAEETHERQVMLFTCDDDLVEAACEACDEPAVIRLPEPA